MRITVGWDDHLVRQGLENFEADPPQIGRRRIYDAVNRITRTMEAYPSERPGQKYKRTGAFGFGWKVISQDTGYQISNRATHKGRQFGRYVVGDAYGTGQAWMHVGRWQVFRDVVDVEMQKLPQQIVDDLKIVGRREGFKVQ